MSSQILATEQLIAGMSRLPQELHDEIKGLVLSVDDEPYVRVIDKDYKQPVQLRLNRRLRKELGKKYYGDGAAWSVSICSCHRRETFPIEGDIMWRLQKDGSGRNKPRPVHQGSLAQWSWALSSHAKTLLSVHSCVNMFYWPDNSHEYHWHVGKWVAGTHAFEWIPCHCSRWSVSTEFEYRRYLSDVRLAKWSSTAHSSA